MLLKHFKTEEEFIEYFNGYYSKLMKFVESISGNNRWWFKDADLIDNGIFYITFSSYKTQEYRNFLLSVKAEKIDNNYEFSVQKQITDLV